MLGTISGETDRENPWSASLFQAVSPPGRLVFFLNILVVSSLDHGACFGSSMFVEEFLREVATHPISQNLGEELKIMALS
jgi:hypothetical protein